MAVLTMSLTAPAIARIAGDVLLGLIGPNPNYGAGMPAISLLISNAGSTGSGLLYPIIEWELSTNPALFALHIEARPFWIGLFCLLCRAIY
jgi:hypothetical protein